MQVSGGKATPFIIIFTDLDGTLLDHTTYKWDEAEPALLLCGELNVPIILVSSKTMAEMEVLRHRLGLSFPFISENGGGIFFPKGTSYPVPSDAGFEHGLHKWSLGVPYDVLTRALQEIRDELGWDLRGFSEMALEEISRLTGLDLEVARLAARRDYDEPFIVVGKEQTNLDSLEEAAKRRGLKITVGGRFYHLHGKNDKGAAVDKVISWYREYHPNAMTIALGDSPNDFEMLSRVDYPVLVRSHRRYPGLEKKIPGLRMTKEIGPEGWNSMVLDMLAEKGEGGIS